MPQLLALLLFLLPAAQAAPVDFELPDLDGKMHRLSEYRGQWVVVNLWATWCPPCRAEIPDLVFFHDSHADEGDAMVLGINFEDAPAERVRAFLDDFLVEYPILRMEPGPRGPFGLVRGLPTTYLISPEGELVHRHTGMVNRTLLERWLKQFGGR